MPLRYTLTLRPDARPHLPIEKYMEILKHGSKELTPETKATLAMIKQYQLKHVPLNLKNEIIISYEKEVTLTRPLEPNLGTFVKVKWDDTQKSAWKKDHLALIKDVLATYEEMGYEVVESEITLTAVENVLKIINKEEEKAKIKIARMNKVTNITKRLIGGKKRK